MKKKEMDAGKSGFPPGLSQPALRALAGAGITQLDQLTHMSEAELKKLHGMGPNGIEKLRAALEAVGLAFADKPSGKPQGG